MAVTRLDSKCRDGHALQQDKQKKDKSKLSAQDTMAAISKQLIATRAVSELVKRKNWAAREPGVIVVFCIVFVVAVGLIGLFIHKQCAKRRASKSQI
ncbi:hypothetical protein TrVGV298_000951 [Trichoderma virens]|nr:hypothetical protein TrVGV298_000951 [Trichoderma virens]